MCVCCEGGDGALGVMKCREFLNWLTKYEVLTFQGGCCMEFDS
jgi:hypothetical protein